MMSTADFRRLLPARLADIEKRIDGALLEAAQDGRSSMTFAARLIPSNLIETVMRRYEGNGWRVTLHGDTRDGDYLEFTLP